MMENNNTELELDIQQVKAVINRFMTFYSVSVCKFAQTDKIITSRKSFILFQFRNVYDNGFWF